METTTMYICPLINYWADLYAQTPFGQIPIHSDRGNGDGFLTVYTRLEDYTAAHPDVPAWRITVQKGNGIERVTAREKM